MDNTSQQTRHELETALHELQTQERTLLEALIQKQEQERLEAQAKIEALTAELEEIKKKEKTERRQQQ